MQREPAKKLSQCTQGREAHCLSKTQNVGKRPAFPGMSPLKLARACTQHTHTWRQAPPWSSGKNCMERVPARTTGPLTDVNSLRPSIVGTEYSLGSAFSPMVGTSGVKSRDKTSFMLRGFFFLLLHVITVL